MSTLLTRPRHRLAHLLVWLLASCPALAALSGCSDSPSASADAKPSAVPDGSGDTAAGADARASADAAADGQGLASGWQVLGQGADGKGLPRALLSVHGTSPTDVWVAGADAGQTGTLLHWDGKAWTREETGQKYTLWWVFAAGKDDVFVGGAGATIVHWDGKTWTRMKPPGVAAQTVYGIWGSSGTDVWAVGGTAGHAGFLWHYDGKTWQDKGLPDAVPLTAAKVLPSLFKVWGRSASDVYAVGSNGLMLRYDGKSWSRVPTKTEELLFTVSGSQSEVVAVGGSASGVVVDGSGADKSPAKAPLLQGVTVAPDGSVWACGGSGAVLQRTAAGWQEVEVNAGEAPQSLHAIWADAAGGIWMVGGNVLNPALDNGALFYRGDQKLTAFPELPVAATPSTVCPKDRIDLAPDGSIARRWNELLLDSVRRDIPRPGVHARNLYHLSLAMHDAWASLQPDRKGILVSGKASPLPSAADLDKARTTAVSYAALRLLTHRYQKAIGGKMSADCYLEFMKVLGLDPANTTTTGSDPIAIGNRVGQKVIDEFAKDGANEADNYADNTGYKAKNPPLVVDQPGTPAGTDPDTWQELNLAVAATQNGIILPAGQQKFICSNWGFVKSFAAPPPDSKGNVHDLPDTPKMSSPEMGQWVAEIVLKSGRLDGKDTQTIDISPGVYGNNPLGTNDGKGHGSNPSTGQPYPSNVVPQGDFYRVMVEYWADGPKSETPPGHWFVVANKATDALVKAGTPLKPFGMGEAVDRLTWDIELYLTLGGAVHDAAIAAWGLKRSYLGPRPITLVRYMAAKGQSSDPKLPSYHPQGLPLQEGVIELISEASSAPGQRHHHLRWWKGEVAIRSWLGEPGDRSNEEGPVVWQRGVEFQPYQRRNFVSPAFPGFISGHSTFSRAAAEVMTAYTGSPYFAGGLGEFTAKAGNYLIFEDGPSVDVKLQWATYYDAADQAGQSRVYGGIHIWPDDKMGRQLGKVIGLDAVAKAKQLFAAKP